jgi:YesN/AraC family two-component response regulator
VANSIHEFIRKNISDTSLSPSSIARYLNLRTNYINQLFHDVKQTTLQEAIEKERQILAKELKRKNHLSDTEIMQKTGIKTREELLKKLMN